MESKMKKIKTGVYQIRNIINNHCYVGSTINFNSRWEQHKAKLNKQKHHSKHLQNAWNKYEKDNFIFEIIEKILDKSK